MCKPITDEDLEFFGASREDISVANKINYIFPIIGTLLTGVMIYYIR